MQTDITKSFIQDQREALDEAKAKGHKHVRVDVRHLQILIDLADPTAAKIARKDLRDAAGGNGRLEYALEQQPEGLVRAASDGHVRRRRSVGSRGRARARTDGRPPARGREARARCIRGERRRHLRAAMSSREALVSMLRAWVIVASSSPHEEDRARSRPLSSALEAMEALGQ
jgi:hypothetical protein